MDEIRYTPIGRGAMQMSDDGHWVEYADLAALREENARLRILAHELDANTEQLVKIFPNSPLARGVRSISEDMQAASARPAPAQEQGEMRELLASIDSGLATLFWTSSNGRERHEGTPDDDDIPACIRKPWREARALLARKPAEERGPCHGCRHDGQQDSLYGCRSCITDPARPLYRAEG